jgi:peptidoglycan/LPS O-acetylase OafA/YrhL
VIDAAGATSRSSAAGNVHGRFLALDGTRGLAAVAVLLWHAFLISEPYLVKSTMLGGTGVGGLHWWITATPLKLLTSGVEAVIIFFLLSGFVVALPVLETKRFRWREYYPRRLIRLYLPVFASVALAVGLILLVSRNSGAPPGSWQMIENSKSVSPLQVLWEATLLQESQLNNPLWSLRWEVLFSLLLPLYYFIATATRRFAMTAIFMCLCLIFLGYEGNVLPLVYMPMFLIGTIAAANRSRIAELATKINHAKAAKLSWLSIVLISTLILIGPHLIPQGSWVLSRVGGVISHFTIVGAMGILFAAIGSKEVGRFLSSPAPQWLGKISFSLYLVHVPILVTFAFLFGSSLWAVAIGVGVPTAIIFATLFTRWVELPSHHFSKYVGKLVRGKDMSEPETVLNI